MKSRIFQIVVATTFAICCASFSANSQEQFDIVFVDHLTAGLIEQDVFVEKVQGSGEVFRVLPSERDKYIDAPLYHAVIPQKHDPFNAENGGPYQKGKAMGITLRSWLGAKGIATVKCEDGWSDFTASFTNLMPDATYTMWHAFMAKGITSPFPGLIDLPIGDRDGSQSVFTTDSKGNGTMKVSSDRCLQLGDVQLASMIAIAYHSDGNVYGALPGDFGTVTHVQLFAMLPDVEVPEKINE